MPRVQLFGSQPINADSTTNVAGRIPITDASDNLTSQGQTVGNGGIRQDGTGSTGGGCGKIIIPNAYTALHTLKQSESFVTEDTTGGGYSVTLPSAAGSLGQEYTILNIGTSNSVTLTGGGSDSITLIGGSTANTQTIGSLTMVTVRCALNHAGTAQWWMK